MKAACIDAVTAAFGRDLFPGEVLKLEQGLSRAARAEAAKDPNAWLKLPPDQQLFLAAGRATKDLQAEAAQQAHNKVLQVLATAKQQQVMAEFPGTPLEALDRMLAFHAKTKGSIDSIDSAATALNGIMVGRMVDQLEAAAPGFFGLIENKTGVRDVMRELRGESTGNKVAANSAKVLADVFETLRVRLNAAGAAIGKLDDYGMPQHHSQVRVARAGREAWKAFTQPLLNRSRYLRPDGARMDDAEIDAFLDAAYSTIATGGVNKMEPGQFTGNGARVNRHNHARQIHYKDADAQLDYLDAYGEKTPYEVILGHVHMMARDIALAEKFGPNAAQTYRLFRDRALKTMIEGDPVNAGKYEKQAMAMDNLYDEVAGNYKPVASVQMARFFNGVRNLQVFAKLGSSSLTAIADEGTMRVAAHINNLPEMQLMRNEITAYSNKDSRRMARRAGLALNTLAHGIDRFGQEGLGQGWTSKAAQFTTRAAGLNFTTDARRAAWGVTQMSAIGHLVNESPSLAKLDANDHRILLSKGLTETDYAVWKRATQEDWGDGNDTMLTPESIYRIPDSALADLGNPRQLREQAANKLLAHVLEETDIAIIQPGARERALMHGASQRGTWKGELVRSFFLFKSFPITMITKQVGRGMSQPTKGGKAAYLSTLTAATTAFGMLAFQASQLSQGKDPADMTEWRTWTKALLKGGALSLYGDFLFDDKTQYGGSALATILGPVLGTAEQALELTVGNVHQAARGEDTHFGAEAMKLGKSTFVPNLWYTKAALDHMVFHQLQEYLSPGYLGKVRARSERFNETNWWEAGDMTPDRAPDLSTVTGEPANAP